VCSSDLYWRPWRSLRGALTPVMRHFHKGHTCARKNRNKCALFSRLMRENS
jgi:hypothetical protein